MPFLVNFLMYASSMFINVSFQSVPEKLVQKDWAKHRKTFNYTNMLELDKTNQTKEKAQTRHKKQRTTCLYIQESHKKYKLETIIYTLRNCWISMSVQFILSQYL